MENEEAIKQAMDEGDLDAASDMLAEQLKPLMEQQNQIRQRIAAGLTKDGKKLRRNAKCPCGSGLKFKKCHLRDMKEKLSSYQSNDSETE